MAKPKPAADPKGVLIRFTPDQMAGLFGLAAATGKSRNTLVQQAVDALLAGKAPERTDTVRLKAAYRREPPARVSALNVPLAGTFKTAPYQKGQAKPGKR